MGVVFCAACHQFAAQPRIVVHFQHVHADVRDAAGDRLGNGKLPTLRRLVRQPGDQINVDVLNAGGAQARDVVEYRVALMQAPDRRSFAVHE